MDTDSEGFFLLRWALIAVAIAFALFLVAALSAGAYAIWDYTLG